MSHWWWKKWWKGGAFLYSNFPFRLLWPSREKRARAVRILEANCDSRCQHWCTALVHSPRPVLTERAALEARRCLHRRRRCPRWRKPWRGWSWIRSPVLRFSPWVDRGDGRPRIVQTIAGKGKQKSENYLMVISSRLSWPKENRLFLSFTPSVKLPMNHQVLGE